MKKLTQQKLAMYKTVQSIVSANAPIWEGVPRFVSMYNTFNERVELLEQSGIRQLNSTVGVSSTLKQLRMNAVEKTAVIANALYVLARDTDNTILRFQTKISLSELKYGSRSQCIHLMETVLYLADEHVSDLEPYGVTIEMVLELNEVFDQLKIAFTRPRTAIIDRMNVTKEILDLESELDILLSEGLDRLMRLFITTNRPFFDAYFNARSVINYGTRHADPSNGTTETGTI